MAEYRHNSLVQIHKKKKVQFKGPVSRRVCDGWRWQRMLAVEACRVTWRGHQLWWPREETQSVQRQHPPRVWTLWPARHRTPAPAQSPGSVSPQSMMDCDDNHPGPDDDAPGLHSTPVTKTCCRGPCTHDCDPQASDCDAEVRHNRGSAAIHPSRSRD